MLSDQQQVLNKNALAAYTDFTYLNCCCAKFQTRKITFFFIPLAYRFPSIGSLPQRQLNCRFLVLLCKLSIKSSSPNYKLNYIFVLNLIIFIVVFAFFLILSFTFVSQFFNDSVSQFLFSLNFSFYTRNLRRNCHSVFFFCEPAHIIYELLDPALATVRLVGSHFIYFLFYSVYLSCLSI